LEPGFYWVAIQTNQGSIYKSLQIIKWVLTRDE
jgi:hypothetical protein